MISAAAEGERLNSNGRERGRERESTATAAAAAASCYTDQQSVAREDTAGLTQLAVLEF